MVVLTQGFLGVTSDVIGPNAFADNLEITLSAPATAVGFDLLNPLGPDNFTITYFSGSTTLGSTTVTSGVISGVYVGATSTSGNITRVLFTQVGGIGGEIVDNVFFKNCN